MFTIKIHSKHSYYILLQSTVFTLLSYSQQVCRYINYVVISYFTHDYTILLR